MNSNNIFDILYKKISGVFIDITIEYIFIPVVCLILFFIGVKMNVIKNFLLKIKRYIQNIIIKKDFDIIFDEGKERELAKQYIKAALLDARSDDTEKKKTAIQQLSQYYGDEVFNGLIKILSREKNEYYRYTIIHALKKIVDERRRNSGN